MPNLQRLSQSRTHRLKLAMHQVEQDQPKILHRVCLLLVALRAHHLDVDDAVVLAVHQVEQDLAQALQLDVVPHRLAPLRDAQHEGGPLVVGPHLQSSAESLQLGMHALDPG